MRNIFFYACCLQLIILTSCNSKDNEKSSQPDTTITAVTTDPVLPNNCRQLNEAEAQSTIEFLTQQFQIFKNTTERVKFTYAEFIEFITKNDTFPKKATDIYLEWGAYTEKDAKRYIANHPSVPPILIKDIEDKPCLLEAYRKPDGQFVHEDKGTICPPPGSCQTVFTLNKKKARRNLLLPGLTIENYIITYDAGRSLTKRVKLDIACIKEWKTHFDDSCGFKAPYIYFFMGAYTSKMAKINGQEPGKPCLLFAYNCAIDPDNDPPRFVYVDMGKLEF